MLMEYEVAEDGVGMRVLVYKGNDSSPPPYYVFHAKNHKEYKMWANAFVLGYRMKEDENVSG